MKQLQTEPELRTFTGQAEGVFQMARQIRNAKKGIQQAISAKQRNPNAVTKTAINDRITELQGMLKIYLYGTGRWNHGGVVTAEALDRMAREIFKIDLAMMRREVKDS